MNNSGEKNRTALGEVLFTQEKWKRLKIKSRLIKLGYTQGQWRAIYERTDAWLLPAFVRDVIVEELPETAELFNNPEFKMEKVA